MTARKGTAAGSLRASTPARATTVLVVLVAALAGPLLRPGVAHAAGPGLTVTTDVDELSMTAGGSAATQVVIANSGDQDLRSVTLTESLPSGLATAEPLPAVVAPLLRAGSSTLAAVSVTATSGFTPGQIGLVVSGTTAGGLTVRATGTVKVTAAAALTAPTATLAFPSDLLDGEERTSTVTLSNATGPAFENVVLRGQGSADIDLRLTCTGGTTVACVESDGGVTLHTLGQGETVLVGAVLTVKDTVHSSAQSLTVVVTAESALDDSVVSSETTASVTLAVFGVDVLSPLGIASLFVVPGVIAFCLFQLLCRLVYPRGTATADLPDYKDPMALAPVLLVSILAYVAFWLWRGIDLRYAVGTRDVVALFLTGVGTGLLAWVLLSASYHVRTGRRVIRIGDRPHVVLRKLDLRAESSKRPALTDGLFLLTSTSDGSGLACGPIGYSFVDGAPSAQRWESALRDDRVDTLATLSRRPRWLTRLVLRRPRSEVRLQWMTRGVTPEKELTSAGDPGPLVVAVNE